MQPVRVLAAAFWLFGCIAGAHANIIYDNMGATTGGQDPLDSDGPQYASFTTDATGLVNTITMRLDNSGAPIPGGLAEVDLWNDASGPNSLVATIGNVSDAQLSGTPSTFAFGNLDVTLDPDTRYWVGLADISGASAIEWSFASDASGTGVAGEFNASSRFGIFANGDGTNGTNFPYQMCVSNGAGSQCAVPSPVPEPAGLTVLGVALAGLGLVRRRRNAH